MKTRHRTTFAILSAVVLAACSGSGTTGNELATTGAPQMGAANASSHATTSQGQVDGTVIPTVPSVQTADLSAAAYFDFSTSWDMDINFELPLSNAYLSLCTDYKKDSSNGVDVKFDSCIVRAPISNGQFISNDIPMTNEISSVIAVLIDYSNPDSPLYVEFSVTPGKETLVWPEGVTI